MSCIYKYKGKKYSEEQFKEYFINNKQEFATSIAKNKDVIEGFKEFVGKNKLSNISSLGKLQGDLMESEKGQIGVNKQQLLMLLGPTMYNKPLAQVAVKELLQNSFDAIKARMNITDNKQTGNIDITVNYDNRTISIKDDGIGMTPDIVKNAFLSIGGTNKEGLDVSERSGGFGLAKVQFLLGSEYVKVVTVRDGLKTSLEATAVQLYNDDFIINKEQTNEPNGSYVEVKIPESYTTPEGTKREIEFPGRYKNDNEKYKAFDILDKPLIGNVNVSFTHVKNKQEHKKVVPIGENTTEETLPPLFSKIDFAWGSADLYMSTDKKENPKHRILSSGIYQFNYSFRFKDWEDIPYDIVVNIKPSVSSTSEQYPFNNQREGFKNTVQEDIKSLNNYLKKYASGEAEKDAKAVFSNITGLPKVDPNKVLTPEEREKLYADVEKTIAENKQRRIEQGLESAEEAVRKIWKLVIDKEGVKDAETGKIEVSNEKNYGSSFKAEKEIEKVEAIETTNFNPALPQYHNNTNFNYLEIPGAAEFFSDFGSVVLEMVRFAGNELGYDYRKLKSEDEKFFAGVSIDKQYGGVHVRKIINAIFVNPLAFDVSSLEEAVGVALHVTIHEINHTTESGEGANFTTALGILYGKIYATGKYGLYEGLFRSVYKKHFETFKKLKNEYDKSSTRNLSESFSGNQIKRGSTGDVQGNVDDVSTRQSSTEGYTGNQENNTKDKTGDVILSKFLSSKQDIEGFKEFVKLPSGQSRNEFYDELLSFEETDESKEAYQQEMLEYQFTDKLQSDQAREIVTTLSGMVMQAIVRKKEKNLRENKSEKINLFNSKGILLAINQINKEYLALKEKETLTAEEQYSIALWEKINDPQSIKTLNQFVISQLKSIGYEINNQSLSERDETDEEDDAEIDLFEDTDEVTGRAGSKSDFAGASTSTKDRLSTIIRTWLSAIPSGIPSALGFGRETFVDMNTVIATLNETLLFKQTGQEMIDAIETAAKTIKSHSWMATIAERLKQEKLLGSQIYNQFVNKFKQKANDFELVRIDYQVKGVRTVVNGRKGFRALRDKNDNLIFEPVVKVIILNRADKAGNLREQWLQNFIEEFYEETEEGYILPDSKKLEVQEKYKAFKDFATVDYNQQTKQFRQVAVARAFLNDLFDSVKIKLEPEALNDILNGFNFSDDPFVQNFAPYDARTNTSSVFNEKTGYLGTIFAPFFTDQSTPVGNPFESTGGRRVSNINAQYIDNFTNTSVPDGKGRKLWAYGLEDPNWAEITRITQDALNPTTDFENSYLYKLLQDKFSSHSVILNKLKSLRNKPKDLKVFIENLKLFTFNTLKEEDREGKELKDMNVKEHVNTKIALFTAVLNKVAGSQMVKMFITTPADKTKMECITTIKHNVGLCLNNGQFQPTEQSVEALYNYFEAEYDRIREFQQASPQIQEQLLSNQNYNPQWFIIFPQLNDLNNIYKVQNDEFVLRDLDEVLPSGETVEQFVKNELRKTLIENYNNTKEYWEKNGIIKDGKLVMGIPTDYLNKIVPDSYSYLSEEDAMSNATMQELYEYGQTEATSYLLADYSVNYLLHNIEMHVFVLGDPAMYVKDASTTEKLDKKLENSNTPLGDFISYVRSIMTNLGKRMAGVQASRQQISHTPNEYRRVLKIADNLPNGENFATKSPESYHNVSIADTYLGGIKAGDGQALISAQEDLKMRLDAGKIDKPTYNLILRKVQEASEDIKNNLPIRPSAKFDAKELSVLNSPFVAQPWKPVVFTNKLEEFSDGSNTVYKRKVDYFKDSEFALYPQFTQGNEIDKLRVLMEDSKTDSIQFLSSVKAGADKVIYNVFSQQEGKITISQEKVDEILQSPEQHVENVERRYYGIQQETPYKRTSKIKISTQQIKLIFDEILDKKFQHNGKSVTGQQLKTLQAKIYKKLVDEDLADFFEEIGVNFQNGSATFTNLEKLQKFLIKNAEKNSDNKNLIQSLKLTEDKKEFEVPLLFNGNLYSIEKLLLSMVSDVISQKIHGRGYILGSELGFTPTYEGQQGVLKIEEYKNSIVYTDSFDSSQGLLPARPNPDNPNEWLPAQVIVPFMFKDSNGKFFELEDFTTIKDGKLQLNLEKLDPKLLKTIGIRIPTQGHSSMASIEIVGFLPQAAGDLLIAPQDFTVQFGSDFDIDKLYAYLYNYEVSLPREKEEELANLKAELKSIIDSKKDLGERRKELYEGYLKLIDFKKSKFEIPEFSSYILDSIEKRFAKFNQSVKIGTPPTTKQELIDYFNSLSPQEIAEINSHAYSNKKTAQTLDKVVSEDNLGKAASLKKHITQWNKKFQESIDSYEEQLEAYEKKLLEDYDAASSDELKELKSDLREGIIGTINRRKEILKSKILTVPTFSEDNLEDNSKESLQNGLMDIYHTILQDPEVIQKSLEGIGGEELVEIADELKEFQQQSSEEYYVPFSDVEKVKEFFDNVAGKIGVGIYSAASTFFVQLQGKNVSIVKEVLTRNGTIKVPRPFLIKTNKDAVPIPLHKISGNKGASRLISIFQSVSVDNAKHKALHILGQNRDTMGVTALLCSLYDPRLKDEYTEYITYFLLQPAIVEHLERVNARDYKTSEREIAAAMLIKLRNVAKDNLIAEMGEEAFVENEKELLQNPGYSLDQLKEEYVNNTTESLQQYHLLSEFLFLQSVAKEIRSIQYTINSDSKGVSKTQFENDYKERRFKEIFKEQKLSSISNNFTNILVEQDGDKEIASIPNLMSQVSFMSNWLYRGSDSEAPILPFLTTKIQDYYTKYLEIIGKYSDDSFSQDIVKRLFKGYLSYIWVDPRLNLTSKSVNQERLDLITDYEGNKSLATEIEEFKRSPEYLNNPKLRPLLQSLDKKVLPTDKTKKYTIFNASAGIIVDIDDIRVAMDVLYRTNPNLFKRILAYQLLMQGYQSGTNFRALIPNYYYRLFNLLPKMRSMNRELNNSIPEEEYIPHLEARVPIFLQQHLQHNPKDAPKLRGEQKDTYEFFSEEIVNEETGAVRGYALNFNKFILYPPDTQETSENYYRPKDATEDVPFPFLSTYNEEEKAITLYMLQPDTHEKGYVYQRIPTLGTPYMDEYSHQEPVVLSIQLISTEDFDDYVLRNYTLKNGQVEAEVEVSGNTAKISFIQNNSDIKGLGTEAFIELSEKLKLEGLSLKVDNNLTSYGFDMMLNLSNQGYLTYDGTPKQEYQNPLKQKEYKEDIFRYSETDVAKSPTVSKEVEQPTGRTIAIIGTAGRSQVPTLTEWNNMLKDAESRVNLNDTLISGGAAFADHIAVKLFLEGKVKRLKLRLPAKIKDGKFLGGYGTAGGTANYYHEKFSKLLGVNTVAEIEEAISKGAEVTYETETSNKAMFIRNAKVAKESDSMLAYTYGETDVPADGGTKDTWDSAKYSDKTHISISKIKLSQTPSKEVKIIPGVKEPHNLDTLWDTYKDKLLAKDKKFTKKDLKKMVDSQSLKWVQDYLKKCYN